MKKFYLIILFAFLASFGSYVSAETWTKVTSTPDDWSGDYLIVYEDKDGNVNVAFDGSLETLDAPSNTKSVTISDGTITTDGCDYYFTIGTTTGGYTIKSASGYYIGRTKYDNGLDSNKSTTYTNTLSLKGGNISIQSGGTYLRYNKTNDSNSKRFRYYKSGQQAIHLYKKSEEAAADQVATPKFDVASGYSNYEAVTASATTATEGAKVHYSYTKNGEPQTLAPDTQAPVLSAVGTYVVTAIAKDATGKLKDSYPATATYTITAPAAPTAAPKPGTYNEATIIKFTSPEGTIVRVKRGDEYFTPVKNIFTKELTAVNGEKTTYTFEVWTEYNDNNSGRVFYTYIIDPSYVPDSYILCTDIKYLTPGTKVIFVGSKTDGTDCQVMTDFNTDKNYRKADPTNVKVSDDGYTLDDIGNAVVFTVAYDGSATDNYKYSFYDSESNYLGSGTKDNSMTNQTAKGGIIPDKAKWSISLNADNNYNATILAKKYYTNGNKKYPSLKYNSGTSPRFACYQSSFGAGLLRIYFNAKTSGVEKVALTDKKAKVYGANGNIVVEAETAADVNVYNAAGMLVAAQKVGAGRTNIALAKGFYVVRAGNTVTKVAVR